MPTTNEPAADEDNADIDHCCVQILQFISDNLVNKDRDAGILVCALLDAAGKLTGRYCESADELKQIIQTSQKGLELQAVLTFMQSQKERRSKKQTEH